MTVSASSKNESAAPAAPPNRYRLLYASAAAALFAAFAFQLYFHAVRTSATVDEPAHIVAGHRHLQCLDFGINPEHPPLLKMLAAAPLAARSPLAEPAWECGSRHTPKTEMFAAGTVFVVRNGIDETVVPARLASSLAGLLLAVLVFAAALEMFGRLEALAALAILAFEPTLIAYGSMVMTDMILAATALGAVYTLYRYRRRPGPFRLLVAGLAFGLLLVAKHSAVLFVPIIVAVMLADAFYFRAEKSGLKRHLMNQAAALAGIFLIGFVTLWAFYGFRYRAVPHAEAGSISINEYIRENGRPEMVNSFSARVVNAVGRTHLFPESYVLGMADIVAWGSRNSFLFGKGYPTGQWYYFPIALSVKTSVALLVLLPLGLLLPLLRPDKRREALFLLAPPLLFLGFAMSSSMTIGIRHVLPVYGFFLVAAAAGAVWTGRKFSFFRYLLVALLVYHAVATLRVAPHYIAFANEFWGGYENTHHVFRDSNVEIGQNLKFIDEYLKRENINDCWIVGFNHRELVEAMQPCRVLPAALRILVSQSVIEPVPPVIEGTVLVSTSELPPRGAGEYAPFTEGAAPVALIGGSTYVFRGRFEVPLAAAMSRAYRSGQLLRLNRLEESLAEARLAVELGPGDPRPHLALGLALARAGAKDEARAALEKTVALAEGEQVFRNAEVRARLELERLK